VTAYNYENLFPTIRCAIDKARSQNKGLYVAFIDLKDAFPSTDLPTLWTKLFNAGVSGPLFDWLHIIYAGMSYVVKHGSMLTDAFKSLIGVLTGDTASPILWNIYFADLEKHITTDANDIVIDGRPISHVEQADDVALFSTTITGLQQKVDQFFSWCHVNFMTISVVKSKWMLFGPFPPTIPILQVGQEIIELVNQYKYVGVTFISTKRCIFTRHYKIKAS
jgi:hypothetical protein